MAYIKRKHDNEKGWYGSLSPRWVPSIPSLCIYTDGKLFNYLYSLGKRELIGNIYPLDSGQINILYCYITLTSLPTLTNRYPPHRPLLPDQRTSQPEAPPGVMCHTQLCPLQGVAAPPTPFPSTLFSIYPPPRGKPKTYLNKLTCNSGFRSTHVGLAMSLSQSTCKLVPGLAPTRKLLVTQIRDPGGWIKGKGHGLECQDLRVIWIVSRGVRWGSFVLEHRPGRSVIPCILGRQLLEILKREEK